MVCRERIYSSGNPWQILGYNLGNIYNDLLRIRKESSLVEYALLSIEGENSGNSIPEADRYISYTPSQARSLG